MHPELEGSAVAVCGSVEDRHGIVLAKSELAKKAGVKTGMAVWQAKSCCPNLVVVPPHYHHYMTFSKLVRDIYYRYTDQIEPFGMDECWLDVTGSVRKFGTPEEIAHLIRQAVKEELGLTVSVGVSFNKVFAKLGSDLKKPDAVTVILEDNFREIVWPLDVTELLYVGRATAKKLYTLGIRTIGQLAEMKEEVLRRVFGLNGSLLWLYANGKESSRVLWAGETIPIKSVGHGTTCNCDLVTDDEVRRVMLELCQDVGKRLQEAGLVAHGIQIDIKDTYLASKQMMGPLPSPTRSRREIAEAAFKLYLKHYDGCRHIRAVTVRAIRLEKASEFTQLDYFGDTEKADKLRRLEAVTDSLADRFGAHVLLPADVLDNSKTQTKETYMGVMPHSIGR